MSKETDGLLEFTAKLHGALNCLQGEFSQNNAWYFETFFIGFQMTTKSSSKHIKLLRYEENSLWCRRYPAVPYVYLVCTCMFYLYNLQNGGVIMLHKIFQKHEAFACYMLADEKSSQGNLGHFIQLVV